LSVTRSDKSETKTFALLPLCAAAAAHYSNVRILTSSNKHTITLAFHFLRALDAKKHNSLHSSSFLIYDMAAQSQRQRFNLCHCSLRLHILDAWLMKLHSMCINCNDYCVFLSLSLRKLLSGADFLHVSCKFLLWKNSRSFYIWAVYMIYWCVKINQCCL